MPAQLALLIGHLPCLGLKCPHRTRAGLSKKGRGKPVPELHLLN